MKLTADLPFEAWRDHIFDHAVTDPQWHWEDGAPFWDPEAEPRRTVEYLTRLFSGAGDLLDRFTPAQVNQALWYLASPACSDYAYSVFQRSVPLGPRIACIHSIFDLYAKCFERCCTGFYGHVDRGPELSSPLNDICYMFWDL